MIGSGLTFRLKHVIDKYIVKMIYYTITDEPTII